MTQRPLILVVDDEREACDLIRMVLDSRGYRTVVAHDGLGAWAAMHEQRPALLILDIQLPGMNGYEMLVRMKKDDEIKDIPVLVVSGLTGSGGPSDDEWAKATGADAFMSKPFDPDKFVDVVKRLSAQC